MTRRSLLGFTAVLLLLTFSGVACGAKKAGRPQLRIYDPSGRCHYQVTVGDLQRRASRMYGRALELPLTAKGDADFHRLTQAVARQGRLAHRVQPIAIEIDYHRYADINVDYRLFPNGLMGGGAIELYTIPKDVAARFVAELHR